MSQFEMKDVLSPVVKNMQPSGIRKFFDIVSEMKDAISLGVGEPDFITPAHIRQAGLRTKLAVASENSEIDAIGACIGPKGARVNKIVEELGGEKIDIIKYSDDPAVFVAEALSPARVVSVEIESTDPKVCKVLVPESQLSLAIGNKGHNVRLAAKLTGWKIDIIKNENFEESDIVSDVIMEN